MLCFHAHPLQSQASFLLVDHRKEGIKIERVISQASHLSGPKSFVLQPVCSNLQDTRPRFRNGPARIRDRINTYVIFLHVDYKLIILGHFFLDLCVSVPGQPR
jgi:hypothetical protein